MTPFLAISAVNTLSLHSNWILWNLFLAFIPLALSFWLFRRRQQVWAGVWGLGWVVFMAFLPNAPYLLTDIIHLFRAVREVPSVWVLTLVILPVHLLAILSGFAAYAISLINQGQFLQQRGARKYIFPSELCVHMLCAIGIYMGRFRRFNSWDLVTIPKTVLHTTLDDLTSKWPVLVILITFLVLTVLYWVSKQIILGLVFRFRATRPSPNKALP
jgi:uncharacterized membrane protein